MLDLIGTEVKFRHIVSLGEQAGGIWHSVKRKKL